MQTAQEKQVITTLSTDTEKNPYVFVVGCPRSGTTLLQRMLNSHPDLAVANDTHFIPRAIKRVPIGMNPELSEELAQAVFEYHRFRRLGIDKEKFRQAVEVSVTYSDLVQNLYAQFARAHGKPLAGEKTPDYCRHIPRLHNLFPKSRFIHIIRDGRDVALSLMDWAHESKGPGRLHLWKSEPLAVSAMWWQWQVATGRTDGRNLPTGLYLEVSYENLVRETEKTLKTISAFLELPHSRGMSRFYKGKTRRDSHLSAKKAWLPATKGLRDWKAQMPADQVELFEAIAGDLLVKTGYSRSFTSFTKETVRTASKSREWWAEHKQDGKKG